jgi:hypothetical protein
MPRKGDITVHGPTILTNNDDGDRNIFASTAVPNNAQGQNGDIWIRYTL